MKRKIYILLFFVSFTVFSQRETDHWYFGNKAGLHFNKGNIDILENSEMNVSYGSTSISDSQGNLLFYSNGQTIWNKNHQIMLNGEDLIGELDNSQSSIIVPKPNSNSTYYIFTNRKTELKNPLEYPGIYFSEIEFSSIYPLGRVKYKNQRITHSTADKITAVHHKNGKDIWVITYGSDSYQGKNDIFYSTLVTEDGVDRSPIKTKLNEIEKGLIGEMKASPDGSKIALSSNFRINIYNFDNTTGVLTKFKYLTLLLNFTEGYNSFGVSFSPNSKLLYYPSNYSAKTGSSYNIMQLELDNLDEYYFGSSIFTIEPNRNAASISLASDGKIYVAQVSTKNVFNENGDYLGIELISKNSIGVINEPDKIGVAADYQHDAINLKSRASFRGLPNFIQSYFRNRIITENKCITDTFNFSLDAYNPITAAKWDFGDGTTSTSFTPTHKYTTTGKFIVKCLVTINGFEVPFYKEITVYPLPVLTPNQELIQCDTNNDGVDYFDLLDIGDKIVDEALNKSFVFYRNKNDAEKNENSILNPNNFQNETIRQEIFVKVISDKGCENITNFFIESKFIKLGDVSNIFTCDSSNQIIGDAKGFFNIKAKRTEIKQLFNLDDKNTIRFYPTLLDAQTTNNQIPDAFFSTSTTLFVRVDNELGCGGIEAFQATVNSNPKINLQEIYTICFNPNLKPPVIISADATNDSYEWKNNAGNIISTNKDFTLTTTGQFSLTVYKTENGLLCSSSKNFTVINPNKPTFAEIVVNTEDEKNNIVDVTVDGNSTYQFSLDNVNFYGNSTSYTFTYVDPGLRTVYIKDINTCEESIQTNVSVIGFKKYFTPNGDNDNDFWNVKGLDAVLFKSIKVSIFNRYGKLIGAITDFSSKGWDGTFNGKLMPPSNYWFTANIIDKDDKIIQETGNFSLIRN